MLSPEAAAAIGINKDSNNIVKITKRSNQDERVYGSAVIASNGNAASTKEPEPVVEPELVVEHEPIEEPEPEPEDDILDFLSKPVEAPKEQSRPVHPHVAPAPAEQPTLFEEPEPAAKPEPRRSLNDVLMEQKEDHSIASSFQNKRVQDLAKSININDKFLFIKELFRGKGEEFGMAIQKLNRCESIEEAFNEIDIMKKFYFWDTSSPAYLALCDLVRRKFI